MQLEEYNILSGETPFYQTKTHCENRNLWKKKQCDVCIVFSTADAVDRPNLFFSNSLTKTDDCHGKK